MATRIPVTHSDHPAPECDQAPHCYWFEKKGTTSSQCANRDSMICRKRRDDVFSPHEKRDRQAG